MVILKDLRVKKAPAPSWMQYSGCSCSSAKQSLLSGFPHSERKYSFLSIPPTFFVHGNYLWGLTNQQQSTSYHSKGCLFPNGGIQAITGNVVSIFNPQQGKRQVIIF